MKFLWYFLFMTLCLSACNLANNQKRDSITRPNILVILTDQWRADAFGHRGNPDVLTPNIDRLAKEGVLFVNAVSGMPVCTPARASILTGQRPLTNGVFMNDVQLDTNAVTLAKMLAANDYKTAYIGKWHLDGQGRSTFIPPGNRRQGFQYWKVLECAHNYNHSIYYSDTPDTLLWEGYDAFAQTDDACDYISKNAGNENPFLMFLSLGPPHAPYHTAPEEYRKLYSPPDKLHISPNVPDSLKEQVKKDFAGYYAHCTALDAMVGNLREALSESGVDKKTIILFLSDHGDLLGSHGYHHKQQPYDESVKIPVIFYIPKELGGNPDIKEAMINVEDIMPTLLGLVSIEIPSTVEGVDYHDYILGGENPGDTVTLITCVQPFGQWTRKQGGKECRGLCSPRYTYAKDMDGHWLFFDNQKDPYQMNNLVGNNDYKDLINSFDLLLTKKLEENGDDFLPGLKYVKMYNYPELNASGTVPYKH